MNRPKTMWTQANERQVELRRNVAASASKADHAITPETVKQGVAAASSGAHSAAAAATKHMESASHDARDAMIQGALEVGDKQVDKMLQMANLKLKAKACGERGMPHMVQRFADASVDSIWPDLARELKDAMMDTVVPLKQREPSKPPPCCALPLHPYLHLRAFILYHYLPFDKTIWESLRNPYWVLLTAVTMIPTFAIRTCFFAVVLVLLVFPSSELDEYQLVNFILQFKGFQFISGGIVMMMQGALRLFYYTTFASDNENDNVDDDGYGDNSALARGAPGVREGWLLQVVDILGSAVLVWLAALLLPCSYRKAMLGGYA